MQYELYPPEGSREDKIIDEYLEHTNGTLLYLSDGKFYLDLPGESYIYEELNEMIADMLEAMVQWKRRPL